MKRRISTPLATLAGLAACLAFCGCGEVHIDLTSRSTSDIYDRGDPQAAINFHSAPQPTDNSYGLHQSMLGSAYLALGDTDDAYAAIRKAYDIMNSYMSDAGGEPHFYKPEADKSFLGDPVEESLNSWYMALLNFQRHDYSNCVAACRNAILADQPLKWEDQSEEDAKKGLVPKDHYVDDNGMLYLLELRGMLRAGGWSKDDMQRVEVHGKEAFLRCSTLFDPSTAKQKVDQLFEEFADPKNNVIFVIDLGLCPKHVGVGEYHEKVHIAPVLYPDANARLIINGQAVPTERVCDVGYQCVHRGDRTFDETLNGRADFKHNAMEGGKVGVGVGVAMLTSDNANVRAAGAVVAGVGLLFMALSANTHPEADLRQWEALPGQINLVVMSMKPGRYAVTCEGLDINLSPLAVPRTCIREFHVHEKGDTLVYLRPLPACANPTPAPAAPANQASDNAANAKQIQQSNDMGKEGFAREKARRDAEEKAKTQPTPPAQPAPATPATPPVQEAPATPAPAGPAGTANPAGPAGTEAPAAPATPATTATTATSSTATPAGTQTAQATAPEAAPAPAQPKPDETPGTWSSSTAATPTPTTPNQAATPATPANGGAATGTSTGGTWSNK